MQILLDLKRSLKAVLRKIGRQFIDEEWLSRMVRNAIAETRTRQIQNLEGAIQSLQHQILVLQTANKNVKLEDIEYSCFSQNGEDGILNYLFSRIGTTNKRVLEICVGDGTECNATNLIVHHGWDGLLFDGSEENVRKGKEFFNRTKETVLCPPSFECAWLTSENINELVKAAGFEGEIDLLSLDVDGVDYWIWKALTVVKPRAVVIEYNQLWDEKEAMTVPNAANFRGEFFGCMSDYGGASLRAFVELGKTLGYRLVGAERLNFNAFFLRNDVGTDLFPEVQVADCLVSPLVRKTSPARRKNIQNKPWVDVSREPHLP